MFGMILFRTTATPTLPYTTLQLPYESLQLYENELSQTLLVFIITHNDMSCMKTKMSAA